MMGFAIPEQESCAEVSLQLQWNLALLSFSAGVGEKSVLLLCYLQSCSAVLHHSEMTFFCFKISILESQVSNSC